MPESDFNGYVGPVGASGLENHEPGGCCQENAAADFSMLTLPSMDAIDLSRWNLWLAMVLVMLDPFYKPVIGVFEYKTRELSKVLGEDLLFEVYVFMAFLHSTLTITSFIYAVREQPWFECLQSNNILLVAYVLLLFGLGLKVYTYYKYGWRQILGVHYFKASTASKLEKEQNPIYGDPYFHPNGTASILCLCALALLRASLAGLIICVLLTVANICAHRIEQYLLQCDLSKFITELQFTKIKSMKER